MAIKKNAVLNFAGGELVNSEFHTIPATVELTVEMGCDDPNASEYPLIIIKTPEDCSVLDSSVDPETGDVVITYAGGLPK